MRLKAILNLVIGAALAIGAGAVSAAPAQAAARNGFCEVGEFCYYYNTGLTGSVSDFTASVGNYGTDPATCYVFKTPGYAGYGQCIKNNAAAVYNMSSQTVRIYYNSNFNQGYANSPFLDIAPGVKMNLKGTNLYNQNASHEFRGTTTPTATPPAPVSFGKPGTNPYPSAATRAPNLTARAAFVQSELLRLTGANRCQASAYRSDEASTSNHNSGNALDCVISNAIKTYPTATQRAYGWQVAEWLRTYAVGLQVRYVIWDGKIWSVARASEGWRNYTGGYGVTAGHYDHVHVSIQNPYGD